MSSLNQLYTQYLAQFLHFSFPCIILTTILTRQASIIIIHDSIISQACSILQHNLWSNLTKIANPTIIIDKALKTEIIGVPNVGTSYCAISFE